MIRIRKRWSAVWIIAASLCCATRTGLSATAPTAVQESAQPPGQREPVPTIHATARLVTLDVAVVDAKGNTVTRLTRDDFQLLEDGALQRISGFEEHHRPLQEQIVTKLPPNTFGDLTPPEESSGIVLLLDVLDSPAVKDQMYLRNQMIAYMKTVPEGTRMAIFQLDTRLHLLQGFTSDRDELMAAVMQRDKPAVSPLPRPCLDDPRPGSIGFGGSIPPINYTGLGLSDNAVPLPDPCLPDPALRHSAAEVLDPYAEQNAVTRGNALGLGVAQLVNYLSSYPGRKSLLWFYSQAAPSDAFGIEMESMLADSTSFADRMGRNTRVLTLNQIALTLVNTTMEWFPVPKPDLDSLVQLIANTNGLKEVIQHVEDKAWNYYTLSYTPENAHFDGAFRKLQVKLERQGLHLQYRPGYYAVNDEDHRSNPTAEAAIGSDAPMQAAMHLGGSTPRDVRFTAHIIPGTTVAKPNPSQAKSASAIKGATREYRINYTVDAKTLDLKQDHDGTYRARVDFVCVVYDSLGKEVNSIASHASVHADARTYAGLLKDGVDVEQTISVPAKGDFFLRIGVRDLAAAKVGVVEVPLGEIKTGLAENGAAPKP